MKKNSRNNSSVNIVITLTKQEQPLKIGFVLNVIEINHDN